MIKLAKKEENPYWDLDMYHSDDILFENFYRDVMNGGNKTQIHVHRHSCAKRKYPKLEVGKEYWIDIADMMSKQEYIKCKISYIRNGVIFYIRLDKNIECHFDEFCIMHYYTEPLELNVNLNPDYYEVISTSGKMKVNYLNK